MSHHFYRHCLVTVSVLAFLVTASPANAQEISWRRDYPSARREAWRTQRPILIDFGTSDCFWCSKLETTTFRDPRVAGLLNGEFIALKVNADREPRLANAVGIQGFPTLVLASPEGRILNRLEGYQDAAALAKHLAGVVEAVGGPVQMRRDYQDAAAALTGGDNGRAIALLKRLVSGGTIYPVQVRAKQMLEGIELQASERLRQAAQLREKGQNNEAANGFADVLRIYPGTEAARQEQQMLSPNDSNTSADYRPR